MRDSAHLKETLKEYKWEDSYCWLSLDVSSLYTSIPHRAGLQALQHLLFSKSGLQYKQAEYSLKFIEFYLTHNYFVFEDTYYLQPKGTAMGVILGPVMLI